MEKMKGRAEIMKARRVRTGLGCRKPDTQVSAVGCSELIPGLPGVGEFVAYLPARNKPSHKVFL